MIDAFRIVSVSLPVTLIEHAEVVADALGVSRQKLLRECIERALADMGENAPYPRALKMGKGRTP